MAWQLSSLYMHLTGRGKETGGLSQTSQDLCFSPGGHTAFDISHIITMWFFSLPQEFPNETNGTAQHEHILCLTGGLQVIQEAFQLRRMDLIWPSPLSTTEQFKSVSSKNKHAAKKKRLMHPRQPRQDRNSSGLQWKPMTHLKDMSTCQYCCHLLLLTSGKMNLFHQSR